MDLKIILQNKKNLFYLGLILCLELFSFFAYFLNGFDVAAFGIISVLFLVLALYKLDYALLVSLVELIIGSKGYLFSLSLGGAEVSIRLAFFSIIILVYLFKLSRLWKKEGRGVLKYLRPQKGGTSWLLLGFFVLLALFNGWLGDNGLKNIFLDFNAWLYLLLFFPWLYFFRKKENESLFWRVFYLATIWLAIKSLIMAFIFSHNFPGLSEDLYLWLRRSGIGEVTVLGGGFVRVFFQSQLYCLLAFLLLFFNKSRHKLFNYSFFLQVMFLAVVILSFSRSFWLGLASALLVGFIYLISHHSLVKTFRRFSGLIIIVLFSFSLCFILLRFPYPPVKSGSGLDDFSDRLDFTSGEAAISSRWELLEALKPELKENFLWGRGFGASVTYNSKDPRILESNPQGIYTTYAFEWGYLDLWLKLGLFGFLSYLYLLLNLFFKAWSSALRSPLAIALVSLLALNVFTPYLNHPLGLGFIIFMSLILSQRKYE